MGKVGWALMALAAFMALCIVTGGSSEREACRAAHSDAVCLELSK